MFCFPFTRGRIFNQREQRIHPLKDNKILTDWNGLMIAALANGGKILKDETYTNAAEKAANFILTNLKDDDGRLFKRYRNGSAGLQPHIDDYSFFIWALLDLYETSFDTRYLRSAIDLAETMADLAGVKIHEEIELKYTGLQPGENLHEKVMEEGPYSNECKQYTVEEIKELI